MRLSEHDLFLLRDAGFSEQEIEQLKEAAKGGSEQYGIVLRRLRPGNKE